MVIWPTRAVVTAGTYVVQGSDTFIPADSTAGVVNITLPLAASVPNGRVIIIFRVNTGANLVNWNCSGSDHLVGTAGQITSDGTGARGRSVMLISDGISLWYDFSSAIA